ncbi:MAG TPA: serine protease [Solirubrobacterales bacterium]|jgi:secreted trypsin-like serine protease|nr:serine protease [Solirubrobacterales bacterium]
MARLRAGASAVLLGLLAALLCAGPAAADGAHASIVGGRSASIAEFPWLAFIEAETRPEEGFQCTGTVIAPRLILTAGHCVQDIESGRLTPAADFAVATGVDDLHDVQAANISRVTQALVYPGFKPSLLRGDAGLLVLATPTAAPAIPLASSAEAALYASGTSISLAGWGLTNANAKDITGVLRAASAVVQSTSYCRSRVASFYPFFTPSTQLCAIAPPDFASGTCHGDSGGPAIALANGVAVQVGITSLGEARCATKLPGVFTRVDRISPWVAGWVAAVETGAPAPAIKVPRAKLPRLTMARARGFVVRGLREDFGHRFSGGAEKRAACVRLARTRVKCQVEWFQGGNDYFGTITVFYVLGRESVLWNDRYVIHWASDSCLRDIDRGCPVHTQR